MSTTEAMVKQQPALQPGGKRFSFGSLLGGGILVVLGSLWALDVAELVELRWAIVLPALLIVVGVALIIGAWSGPHVGPVVAGLLLSIVVIALAVVPLTSFGGGVGNREFRVTQQTGLAPSYQVGVGDLTLDLGDLALVDSTAVDVSVGAGNVMVVLPPSIPVDIEGTVGAGQVNVLGETGDGLSVNRHYRSEGFESGDVTLTLELSVGAGSIEVTR